jgi:hypothetical protein
VALLVVALAAEVNRNSPAVATVVAVVALLILPVLFWWRSAPLEAVGPLPGGDEQQVLQWIEDSVPDDAAFLINLEEGEAGWQPRDGGAWLPLYGQRPTVLQLGLPDDLLREAMEPDALDDEELRTRLSLQGVTHLYVGGNAGPLDSQALLEADWAQIAHRQGSAFVFELLPPQERPQSSLWGVEPSPTRTVFP